MKTAILAAILLSPAVMACDEPKSESASPPGAASSAAAAPSPPPPPPTPAPAPTPTFTKRTATDCAPHSSAIDFGADATLEKEVRRKLGKDKGPIAPSDLAQIKSINLANATTHQVDPCIFPMFTSMKDLFLGPGEYDDLSPIRNITTLESLRASLSAVKDLHPIEGLKRLDRLDLSHTLVDDESLKSVGSLVNLTELMLDETTVSDLTPIANLKKLERLSIKKTQVQSLAPLAGIRTLKFLYIADTTISDISPVQPLISGGMKLVQN